jgi:hypothetical protein
MWECPRCHESVESSFDLCWNGGTTKEGVVDPGFQRVEEIPSPPDSSLDAQLAERFVCAKCKHHGATVKRIATTGTSVSKILDIQHNIFIAASCPSCGYTEIYNPEVLEGKPMLGTVLDAIFGMV